jgi:dimethylglycine catabolism B
MPRPALRPMRVLPVLEAHRSALEKCVFCPKLCRSACPVSNAEPRETITPWGKMTAAWTLAHGDVSLGTAHGAPPWACTGCLACREACDHRNPVADVLLAARAAIVREGAAPAAALRVISSFARHDAETKTAARALGSETAYNGSANTAIVVGCGYLRRAPAEARDAMRAARALAGEPVHVVDQCCGLPLKLAGDGVGFERHAQKLASEAAPFARLLVVDAGCALALRRYYPAAGIELRPRVELLVEVAAERLPDLAPIVLDSGERIRWHDPCHLGRSLGIYDAPRKVLARILDRPPEELVDRREQTPCSGAGGLLPCTMPAVARDIAAARIEAHRMAGGGRVVTACASSLVALRKAARHSGIAIDDLATYIARSVGAASQRRAT